MLTMNSTQHLHRAWQFIGIIVLFALNLTVSVAPADARTWYILPDGTGDAPTIQAGVDAASDGDIVLVAAGTYSATTVIDIDGTPKTVCVAIGKSIALTSESGPASTIISNASANPAIYLHDVGSTTTVSGFRIQTSFTGYGCLDSASPALGPFPPQYPRGIICRNASPSISGNVLAGNEIGIELFGSAATVENNTVEMSLRGIGVYANSNAEILGNAVHDCGVLIDVDGAATTISGNELYDGCIAIYATNASTIVTHNSIHDMYDTGVVCHGITTLESNRFTNTNIAVDMASSGGQSLVTGNVFVQHSWTLSLADNLDGMTTVEGNTIDRSNIAIFGQGSRALIRRNIIVGSVQGIRCELSFPVIECNDIVTSGPRYAGGCTDQTGVNGNISVDPLFCGVPGSGNYFLRQDSPCAPDNHPNGDNCGVIGALPVGCGIVSTKSVTWGAVKAMYRR